MKKAQRLNDDRPGARSDAAWIKANPGRRFRVRETDPGRGWTGATYGDPNLRPTTILKISECGTAWSMRDILVFGEVVDNDRAAQFALAQWDQVIMPRLLDAAHRRADRRRGDAE